MEKIFETKSIITRPNLNEGQLALYTILHDKIKNSEALTADETIKLWVENVATNKKNGIPRHWDNYFSYDKETDKFVGAWREMPDTMIKFYALTWLMRAIGALVLKGYLKVIPTLELE